MPRTVFCTVFVMVFSILMFMAPATWAQDDPYTVENIEIDITADNAVEAREQAFEAAQIKGYEILAARFLSGAELESLGTPDINTVANFVQDYEVTNEKLSAIRYKGVYKIRYSSKAFGTGANVENASGPQKGEVLVLPFYKTRDRVTLWQENPFLEAWARARGNNVLGRAIVPVGDLEDITQVRDEQALNYDPSRLNAMRLRYRAKETAILVAEPEISANGNKNILVRVYNAKPYGPELAQQLSVIGRAGEAQDQLYNRAIGEISQALKQGWQRQTAVKTAGFNNSDIEQQPLSGPVATVTAQLGFSSVREWVDTKRLIERTRGVQSVQLKSMSPRQATVNINFQGSVRDLGYALSQSGIKLNNPQTHQGQVYQLQKLRR